jgi:uncharacterized membrane protein
LERDCVSITLGSRKIENCVWDDRLMPSKADPTVQASVIVASFENRHAAEHLLALLGREFGKQARRGHVTAFVVRDNKDGSLKLTQSRVLTAEGLEGALIGFFAAVMLGLIGIIGMLKGAKAGRHAVRVRAAHVGSDEHAAHAIFAQAGPNAAIALVCCDDPEMRYTTAARARDRAISTWDGSRTEFLANLDPGSSHDWVRDALGELSGTKS